MKKCQVAVERIDNDLLQAAIERGKASMKVDLLMEVRNPFHFYRINYAGRSHYIIERDRCPVSFCGLKFSYEYRPPSGSPKTCRKCRITVAGVAADHAQWMGDWLKGSPRYFHDYVNIHPRVSITSRSHAVRKKIFMSLYR